MSQASVPELVATVPQVGRVEWIGVRTAKRGRVEAVEATDALEGLGLRGDYREQATANPDAKRHVTLIQSEHLPVVAALVGVDEVAPSATRRNIVVSGIPLIALKGLTFAIGDAVLEGTGECHPCSRMEQNIGVGGYQAMRGHGGLTARIVRGGRIAVADEVRVIDQD